MRIVIYVGRNDIRNGIPKECALCPIAIALSRKLCSTFSGEVGKSEITIFEKSGKLVDVKMPLKAQNFVKKFDKVWQGERNKMKPFQFTVDIPIKYLNNATKNPRAKAAHRARKEESVL